MARDDGFKNATLEAMTLFKLIRAFLIALWPVSILAAPAMQQSFDSIPFVAWCVVVFNSTLGGLTALMLRINAQINASVDESATPPKPIKNLPVLVASQMLCSWSAGAAFFFFGLHWEWPLIPVAGAIVVASFGGAKTIESLAAWMHARTPTSMK